MIKEYLNNRRNILDNEIDDYKEKIIHCKSQIKEIDTQIKEMKMSFDEASSLFSLKARENIDSNNFETLDLENEKSELIEKISVYNMEINELQKEINIIDSGIDEINVSRETSDMKDSNRADSDIKDKINLCIKICKVDPARVEIELKQLLRMI